MEEILELKDCLLNHKYDCAFATVEEENILYTIQITVLLLENF